jgi:outer membrane protein TolC
MRRILIFIIILLPVLLWAQPKISLQNAIDTALKNNFDIQIARNNALINKNNNRYGMAGGLPVINAGSTDNESVTNLNQKLSNGTEIQKNNSASNNLTAGINASMTLFNGFRIIATKDKLSHLQKQSELLLNSQIQNTVASVMIKYYDIVRQKGYLRIMESNLDLSKKKLEIITQRRNVGMANDADLMQAQIDFNIAAQNLKSEILVIEQAKTDLLQLMCVKKYFPLDIDDTIITDNNLQFDSIINSLDKNPQYLSLEQQVKINEQIAKEINAQRYPSLKLNTGYNFNLTKSEAGFNLLNQSYGPSVGVTLQIPLYNGNIYKIQHDAAKYNLSNAMLQKESMQNALKANAVKTYLSYNNTLQELESQQANYELSGKLVDLVIKRFQLNQATILEMKAAQESYESVGYQLINLQFAAKVAEIQLKSMIYKLEY